MRMYIKLNMNFKNPTEIQILKSIKKFNKFIKLKKIFHLKLALLFLLILQIFRKLT